MTPGEILVAINALPDDQFAAFTSAMLREMLTAAREKNLLAETIAGAIGLYGLLLVEFHEQGASYRDAVRDGNPREADVNRMIDATHAAISDTLEKCFGDIGCVVPGTKARVPS